MRVIEMNTDNGVQLIAETIKNQEECFLFGVPNQTLLLLGDNPKENANIDFCISEKLPICDVPNMGGTLVLSEGDIELAHFSKDFDNKFCDKLATELIEFLSRNSINASKAGNDILVDDKYKVAGYSTRRIGVLLYSAFHISMNANLELIQKVCRKPMLKIPKGLREFGIKEHEILEIVHKMADI